MSSRRGFLVLVLTIRLKVCTETVRAVDEVQWSLGTFLVMLREAKAKVMACSLSNTLLS